MGAAYYVVLEKQIDGLDTAMDAKLPMHWLMFWGRMPRALTFQRCSSFPQRMGKVPVVIIAWRCEIHPSGESTPA